MTKEEVGRSTSVMYVRKRAFHPFRPRQWARLLQAYSTAVLSTAFKIVSEAFARKSRSEGRFCRALDSAAPRVVYVFEVPLTVTRLDAICMRRSELF